MKYTFKISTVFDVDVPDNIQEENINAWVVGWMQENSIDWSIEREAIADESASSL